MQPVLDKLLPFLGGVVLLVVGGSEIGRRLGPHGFDQWLIVVFAVGLVLCAQFLVFETA
jgi:hypothetical protein